jgi:large subunit ribosomal protein L4
MAVGKFYLADGSYSKEIALPEELFEAEVSKGCLYLTVKAYLANQRQGTHKTKTRAEVSGTNKKPWKQKGTGNARSGDNRSPIWVRGGKAHGPQPRDYSQKVNKKVKFRALISALTIKAQGESVHVFETLNRPEAKTKAFVQLLEKSGLNLQKNLFLAATSDNNLLASARNIPMTRVLRVQDVNTYEVMRAKNLVLSADTLNTLKDQYLKVAVVGGEA